VGRSLGGERLDDTMSAMCLMTSYVWEIVGKVFTTLLPIVISAVALGYVLYDRRAHLELAAKRGKWCVLDRLTSGEVRFRGIIDGYNASSRANAIRDYHFFYQLPDGGWKEMESEQYSNESPQEDGKTKVEIFNQTGLTLGPYAGMEIRVQSLIRMAPPYEMTVKIVIDDQFGHPYELIVKAEMNTRIVQAPPDNS
jgi:hypothetical protein